MRLRLLPILATLAVGAAVAMSGCGGGGGGSDSLVLYNGQHASLTNALVAEFEKETGIAVRTRSNSSLVLATQILQEGDASPADVFLSENSPELATLAQRGLLSKLGETTLAAVPKRDRSPAGNWVAVALRLGSLVYDPRSLPDAQLPESILDLAKPQWKGKVAIAPTDSDFPPVVGAVIARYGKAAAADWLAGLRRNARTYQDEEAVVAAVNSGDVAAGVINQYYWYRLRLELGKNRMHSKLHYFPARDAGSMVNVSGAAVLESSSKHDTAERFVRFLVARTAQKLLARSDDFEYPARSDVPANVALPPLAKTPHSDLSVVALGTNNEAAQLIRDVGFL